MALLLPVQGMVNFVLRPQVAIGLMRADRAYREAQAASRPSLQGHVVLTPGGVLSPRNGPLSRDAAALP
jgi:hypothetical protein